MEALPMMAEWLFSCALYIGGSRNWIFQTRKRSNNQGPFDSGGCRTHHNAHYEILRLGSQVTYYLSGETAAVTAEPRLLINTY